MERELFDNVKFHLGDEPEGFDKGFDDTNWQDIVLPHDWAVTLPFDKKCSSGTGYLPGGIGWYRIHFAMQEELKDKIVSIHFDGVYKHCKIWCNGYYIGEWANGYTAFSYDITHALRVGGIDNVIAVKVSHEDIADSRWYTGSGINKKVTLRIQEKVHGVYEENVIQEKNVTKTQAELKIINVVKNDDTEAKQICISNVIEDVSGKQVVERKMEVLLPAGTQKKVEQMIDLDEPNLWSVDDPYLYTWKIFVHAKKLDAKKDAEYTTKDCMEQKIGLRSFSFDPDAGFFLNGESMKLKGVCLHEDAGCFGNAVPKNVWKRRLEKLKYMGTNTIRMSHNPHSEDLYDLCDEMGFLVIDEIFDEWEGPKNKWSTGHNVYPPKHQGYYEDYKTWHEKDVAAFVKANRNRPSIIMWSVGNEIDYPNDPYCHPSFQTMTGNNDANKPSQERMYNANRPNSERLSVIAKELADLVRREDMTRPVTLASAFPELSANIGLFDALDVIGYNYKEHLYEQDHKRFPAQPIFGSENGHGLKEWKYVTDHEYIAGQCIWTGIDYLGETHLWPMHGSEAGTMTTAGMEKADFDFRCALWKTESYIQIDTGIGEVKWNYHNRERCWNYMPGTEITVEVFSNCDEVELFLNGESLGVKREQYVNSYQVPFVHGKLEAVGRIAGEEKTRCLLESNDAATQIAAVPYDVHWIADGKSIMQLELTMQDSSGKHVIADESMLHFSIEGEATVCGIDNGNLGDTTDYTAMYRRMYKGKMMVYLRSKQKAGEVRLHIEHHLLGEKVITLETQKLI